MDYDTICRYCRRDPYCTGACLNGEPTQFSVPEFPGHIIR